MPTKDEARKAAEDLIAATIAAGHPEIQLDLNGRQRSPLVIAVAAYAITSNVTNHILANEIPSADHIRALLAGQLKVG